MLAYVLSFLFLAAVPADVQQEIDHIDRQIEELSTEQSKQESTANRWQNKGLHWQFNSKDKLEARYAFQQEEEARKKAAAIEEQIKILEKRKTDLLKEHSQ